MSEQWDGRPENPEQDGWHWLRTGDSLVTCEWSAARGWRDETWIVRAWELPYAGPCLTPAEVEAEKAATRREGIEAAAQWVEYLIAEDSTPHAQFPATIRALLEGGR